MRKKVLIAIPTYWPEGSGGTLATHLVVELLSKIEGLEITIITGTTNPEKIKRSNVRYIIDPFLKIVETRYPLPFLISNKYSKIIKRHDIIYIVYAYTFIPIAKKLGKRVIVHLHDYKPISPSSVFPSECLNNPSMIKLIEKSFKIKYFERKNIKASILNLGDTIRTFLVHKWIQEADMIIAVSKRQAELITKIIPNIRNKTMVIYNPLPSISCNFGDEKKNSTPTFLYVGGDSYLKGFPIILGAIVKFLKKGGKAKFVFTNKYSDKSRTYISLVNKLYGNEIIKIVGRIPYKEIIKLYQKVWALIFPSIWEEPLPYAILEAILYNTFPLASRVGGVIELLQGTPAEKYMFNPGDIDDLLEKIYLLQSMSPKEILRMAQNTRELVLKKLIKVDHIEIWKKLINI